MLLFSTMRAYIYGNFRRSSDNALWFASAFVAKSCVRATEGAWLFDSGNEDLTRVGLVFEPCQAKNVKWSSVRWLPIVALHDLTRPRVDH